MLAEHQVVHLLDECERVVGVPLGRIRGQLRSELHVRPAIWELILIDSASRIGKIEYERATGSGRTPDLYVEGPHGPLWIEAAFLLPRFADVEARKEAFIRAVWAEARRIGIPPGSIHDEFYGERAAYGFEMRVPAEHEITPFFRSELIKGFFNAIKKNPDQPIMVDLGEQGATVRLAYVPTARNSGSSSVVIEQPREVGEHAVYRLLEKKAKKYHRRDLSAPLVVCIGSERSTAVRSMGATAISVETAIREACRKYPVLSGVVVVSIEDMFPSPGNSNPSRQARATVTVSQSATFPVDKNLLRQLRFDLVDYGHGWNEWEGVGTVAERMKGLGGTLLQKGLKDGFALTLPAHAVSRVLGGGWSAADLQASYRMTDIENPFRRALSEGRAIVGVELLPHDARSHEPQMMRITFGPPTPLLLQNPKD